MRIHSTALMQGEDIESEDVKKGLKDGTTALKSFPYWFSAHKDYDELCKTFIPTIKEAAGAASAATAANENGSDSDKSVWNDTTDVSSKISIQAKAAKLILFDQLTRNCFRGEEEAYAYDDHGLKVARDLGEMYTNHIDSGEDVPHDFLTGAYSFHIVTALMHSEEMLDHKLALNVYLKTMEDESVPGANWTIQHEKLLEHTAVIEKFGRYPHRNEVMSRETTMEEKEWLSSPDFPDWAASQVRSKKK